MILAGNARVKNLLDADGAWVDQDRMFIGALAPSSEPPPVCAVDLLPARKEECSLNFSSVAW